MRLSNRRILLGVSGSIAAYKSVFLTRLLVKEGAEVQVVMTDAAKDFVGPLSFSTLSKNEVYSEYFNKESGAWANHVQLGEWPDLMLIAPATANTIAKMCHGICDNLLQATFLSSRAPVMLAPAMDLEMYEHDSLADNLELLRSRGVLVCDAEDGELASGLSGKGRMAEPEHIVEAVVNQLNSGPLSGKHFLVNAGPTYEAIDPVRFIGNRSTGKMGISIANELSKRGATVDLVLGPSKIRSIDHKIHVHHVESASEMYEKCIEIFPKTQAAILSAAVADFTPSSVSDIKIKKGDDDLNIQLSKTKDILATLGEMKKDQILVGFAMETNDEEANAKSKLERKNADMIVLNSLREKGAGFGEQTNKVRMFVRKGKSFDTEVKSKEAIASDIVDKVVELLN